MGYSNQIERCSGTLSYGNTTTCPSDWGFTTDMNLIQVAVGTLVGKNPAGKVVECLLSGRFVADYSKVGNFFEYRGYNITTSGVLQTTYSLYRVLNNSSSVDQITSGSLRPILTLKSDVKLSNGEGISTSPYKLG